MATNTVGIDKEVEVDRKENLRDHRLYWIGRRTQDVILSSLALVVLSPIMLATAIAIVVDLYKCNTYLHRREKGRCNCAGCGCFEGTGSKNLG